MDEIALREIMGEFIQIDENNFKMPRDLAEAVNKYSKDGIAISADILKDYILPKVKQNTMKLFLKESPDNHMRLVAYQVAFQVIKEIEECMDRLKKAIYITAKQG